MQAYCNRGSIKMTLHLMVEFRVKLQRAGAAKRTCAGSQLVIKRLFDRFHTNSK